MIELGKLDKQHAEFETQKVRIVAVSNDDLTTAQATQAKFANIRIVADPMQNIAKAMQVIHPGVAPGGKDTNAPTTFLIDGSGVVRWRYRPTGYLERLSPAELLAAINKTWPTSY